MHTDTPTAAAADLQAQRPDSQARPESLAADIAEQVVAHRPMLVKLARRQLRNDAWAEDAVSETLVAALERPQAFGGRATVRTWLVGILRHKLVDQVRRHTREATVLVGEDGEDLDESLFEDSGHWRSMPAAWGQGEAALEQRQFFEVMERCHELLPPVQARVFMMREWLDMDANEICKELQITSTNLWVLLHRARLRLRECLERRWFGTREST